MRPHAGRAVAVSQGVLDEGRQNLSELARVGQDRPLGLVEEDEGPARSLELILPLLAGGVEDLEDMDRLGLSAAALGHVQELGDDVGHALNLFQARAGFRAHVLLRGDQLDLLQAHRQGGEGGPQLVGGVGSRLAFGGQASGHAFTGARQFLGDEIDLFNARAFHPSPNAAGADLFGLGRQVDEGGGEVARERARHQPADRH